jgi:hypothetical protein
VVDSPPVERFRREASIVAGLRHPGIVGLYGVGQTDHVCYLAMPFVTGVTLRQWVARMSRATDFRLAEQSTASAAPPTEPTGRFSIRFDPAAVLTPEWEELPAPPPDRPAVLSDPLYVRRVAELLRDLADALACAHAAGVTHRDLKPENVMVTPEGKVVVIDFGLARSFADVTLTTHSGLMGTPMYMAPEQLAGRPATAASDVYALGLIGYELLAHALPFRATSVERVLGEVLHKPAPPLAARNPAVPPDLANVVHRAMAKKADDRYPTAAELRDDLARHLGGERVSVGGYVYQFNPAELLLTRPKPLAAAGAVTLVLSGFLFLATVAAAYIGTWHAGWMLAVSAVYLYGGWRMPAGRRDGPAAGWATVAASAACWLAMTFGMGTHGRAQMVNVLLGTALVAVGGATALVLLSAATRRWFARVRQARREFDAERGG